MGSKTRLGSYCTKRDNNGVNLVTSRNINTRLARPIFKWNLMMNNTPIYTERHYLLRDLDDIYVDAPNIRCSTKQSASLFCSLFDGPNTAVHLISG